MNNKEKGRLGEQIACNYLIKNKFHILEKNYRTKIGEIDLIAFKDNKISFIEVKSRNSINYGHPSESVHYKKQKKIISTAKQYIMYKNIKNMDIGFDVIEVYLKNNNINYIENAFCDNQGWC
ncbi:MAG: YraN family protein [Tepidibacter sp.]|jgi:putative endonuclease|uniref:YraN family protein n=1 Tax=Tepidibacter sp. TaxID=2529387 RepID=UPI0025D46CBA|nr:YraN family protein [Tepidibacter sp.]MCT4509801.1 YraN family protein [Tepidibacter sp.]